ncbi:hypothetical protein BCR42DRAFT_338151, partial [Absidia repens]
VSAAKAGREYNLDERTAQRWIKEYKRRQEIEVTEQSQQTEETAADEKKKPGPKKTLSEDHKNHLKQFINDNPSAVLDQAVDSLTQQFKDLKIKKPAVHEFMTKECNLTFKKAHFHALARNNEMNTNTRYDWILKWQDNDVRYMQNCVFIDESGFHIKLRWSMGWSDKGFTPIVKVATTRAISHMILGAICAAGGFSGAIYKNC